MKAREKALGTVVVLGAVALLGYLLLSKVLLEPAARLDGQIRDASNKITDLKKENAREQDYITTLRNHAKHTFASDDLRASEQMRARLVELLKASGLGSDKLSLKPVTGSRAPGVFRELGWYVHATGRLEQIVNYVYLLQNEPYLHKIDTIVLAPITRSPEVELQLRYTTLVFDVRTGESPPATQPLETMRIASSQGPDRKPYDVIVARDLMRPYIPRTRSSWSGSSASSDNSSSESSDGRLTIAGLPSWNGKAEIFLKDTSTGQTQVLQVGETINGWRILGVDYRKVPLPDRPSLLSGSRVLLEIDGATWAVELGQSLANRRPFDPAATPETNEVTEPAPATTQNDTPASAQP
jgi:hypothetical protein